MIPPVPAPGQAQRTGCALARTGFDGAIHVDVPLLDDGAWAFGRTYLIEDIARFRSDFTPADRKALIDQAILTLDEFYVHRDLKWARHAVDPGHALRSLRRLCDDLEDLQFHAEVGAIFKSLRDIHTVYVLPDPYRKLVAFLPFMMGACEDGPGAPERFIVTQFLSGFAPEHLKPGCEILTWNGLPVSAAVRQAGEAECAANAAARVALGVRLMTVRWLGTSALPPASWVTLGYNDLSGIYREMRLSWRLLELADDSDLILPIQAVWKLEEPGGNAHGASTTSEAMDQRSLVEDEAIYRMFAGLGAAAPLLGAAPPPRQIARRIANVEAPEASGNFGGAIWSAAVGGDAVRFGVIRIRGFNTDDADGFVAEFRALLERMPPDFLLIDIRSNPGGDLNAAERLLQFLTPREVVPLQFQFRATRQMERLVTNDGGAPWGDMADWVDRIRDSVANGQQYSREGPLTAPGPANSQGQTYFGTVGLLVDAITYSSGDIFAAQFADLEIGPLIGVDANTGGGGGNMVFHGRIREIAPEALGLRPLPGGARIHFAIRRCRRGGTFRGELIEEAGVSAAHHLPVSADDLLHGDRDLMHRVAEVLSTQRRRAFRAEMVLAPDAATVTFVTDHGPDVKPLSLFVAYDGRPDEQHVTEEGKVSFTVPRLEATDRRMSVSAYELKSWSSKWLQDTPMAVYRYTVPKRDP